MFGRKRTPPVVSRDLKDQSLHSGREAFRDNWCAFSRDLPGHDARSHQPVCDSLASAMHKNTTSRGTRP